MIDDEIFVGDTPGLYIDAQHPDKAAIDITGLTVSLIVFKPGSLTSVIWDATVYGTTEIFHQCIADDFDLPGEYRIQALVTGPSIKHEGKMIRKTVYQSGQPN